MTHGAMIAVHAAQAAATRARASVLDAFRVRGATAPERACALAELGLAAEGRPVREWLERGVLRAVDGRGRPVVSGDVNGRAAAYYLDESAYVVDRDRARPGARRAAIALAIVLLLLLVPLALLVLAR